MESKRERARVGESWGSHKIIADDGTVLAYAGTLEIAEEYVANHKLGGLSIVLTEGQIRRNKCLS